MDWFSADGIFRLKIIRLSLLINIFQLLDENDETAFVAFSTCKTFQLNHNSRTDIMRLLELKSPLNAARIVFFFF